MYTSLLRCSKSLERRRWGGGGMLDEHGNQGVILSGWKLSRIFQFAHHSCRDSADPGRWRVEGKRGTNVNAVEANTGKSSSSVEFTTSGCYKTFAEGLFSATTTTTTIDLTCIRRVSPSSKLMYRVVGRRRNRGKKSKNGNERRPRTGGR